MKLLKTLILSLVLISTSANTLLAHESPNIVVSIKPLHSLVASVMGDKGNPQLLLESNASPHTYQMRPSQAKALQDADLVIWVGKYMENFLARAVENISTDATVLTLEEAQGIHRLPFREGGIWGIEKHHDHEEHHDHDEEKHDSHGHEEDNHSEDGHAAKEHDEHEHAAKEHDDHDHDQGHDDHGHDDHGHEEHDHDHGEFDVHIWLDPDNARRIVEILANELTIMDPDHADIYSQNAKTTIQRIDETEESIKKQLSSINQDRFVVFHDAYRYFEEAFGIEAFGSFTVEPTRLPSARRLSELREAINHHNVVCVFSEPQFKPDLVETVIEQTGAKTGILDPLGAGLDQGPDAWFMIMQRLADSLTDCLGTA
ncbi:MAG: zinc ABC transporter substrate-binding protein [Gammaproteobacteria bacterium]|nr:zinc ABC transporter substrate-binding protein [Gammaproteobacteria bacterium]